ncbi:putative CPXV192-like protein [Vaccinia virus]|nr:putative CPXV192-like protein [Vaccinia virus]
MNTEILFVNRIVLVNIATTYEIIDLIHFLHDNYLNVINYDFDDNVPIHYIATWLVHYSVLRPMNNYLSFDDLVIIIIQKYL